MSRLELSPPQLELIHEVATFLRRNSQALLDVLSTVPEEDDQLCLIATGLIAFIEAAEGSRVTEPGQALIERIRYVFKEPDYFSLVHATDIDRTAQAKKRLKNYE